jgi:hypothetical protein
MDHHDSLFCSARAVPGRRLALASALAAILLAPSTSLAQQPPAAAPPGAPQPLPSASPPGYAPVQYFVPAGAPAPRIIKWNEGEQIPPGYHQGTQIRKGMVIAGSVLFGSAWVPTAIVGSFTDPYAVIPVAGPLITAARVDTQDLGSVAVFWLIFDGVQQAAGLSLLIAGLTAKQPVLVRDDVREAKTQILPVPMTFGNRSGGLGIAGTF